MCFSAGKILGKVLTRPTCFGVKARPLHEKDRLYNLLNLESDTTKTFQISLNRIFEWAKQSNSRGGSPAEPAILLN